MTARVQIRPLDRRSKSAQEDEGRFRQIVGALPQLVWTFEPDGACDFVGKQWVQYTGEPEAGLLGSGWLDPVHPEDRANLTRRWQTPGQPANALRVEVRLRRHDGKYRWFDLQLTAARGPDGHPVKWTGSGTDIHERRESGVSHQEFLTHLQAISANLNEGLIASDGKGSLLHWNPAALAMHGFADGADWCRSLPEFQSIFELSTLEGVGLPFDQWPMPRLFRGEPVKELEVRVRRLDADWLRTFSYNGSVAREPNGSAMAFLTIRDVTERNRNKTLLLGQKQVLEMVALGDPLPTTLEALVNFVEAQAPELLCSVLLLDADGQHLRQGAAPSLPEEYNRAIDGLAIGPGAGSCGTAVYRREPVIVADTATDPLWADYKHVALPHGLRACWSTPIFDAQKLVLGTFAIYHRQPGQPNAQHLELINFAAHTAAICITRQRIEHALATSEARYALAVRGTNDGLWDWEIATGADYLSPRWKELLGFADHELPNRIDTFVSRLHPEDAGRTQAAVQAHLERRAPYNIEVRLRMKNGDYRWFLCRGQAEWSEPGRPVRMAGSITDINERVLVKRALRDAAEFNRQIIASADDGIVVLDRELCCLVWNHFMEALLDIKAEVVVGRGAEELFPWVRRGGQLVALQRVLAGESVAVPGVMRIKRGSHQTCWVQARLSALRNAKDEIIGVIAVIIDVTERVAAEKHLRGSHEQMRALAARLQSVREEQSAQIAREIHDVLGQQLTALKLDLAWMKRRLAAVDDPALRSALTDKLAATSGLVDTTIHTVQKVATELRPGLLDKLGLAVALAQETKEFADRAGLRCQLDISNDAAGLESKRAIDVFRVSQELLTNIARHAQAREFTVRLHRVAERLVLEIIDDGRGINQQDVARANSLGLLGMRERAQLLGGTLELSGAPGRGTRAVLDIPFQAAP